MPRDSSGPLRGTPAAILADRAPDSIILVRAGVVQSAQSCWVDFSAAGAEQVLGAGRAATATGVAVYWAYDASVVMGDVFRHDDKQYTVSYVSPDGWGAIDGHTIILSWGDATGTP